jgi:oligopeptide/dipeptide ABC transporter ATP-binding protein
VSAFEAPDGCSFAPRCDYAEDRCRVQAPVLEEIDGADVRCLRAHELGATLAGMARDD